MAADYDVAVAGLGPTGAVLALLLAREGMRVLAVDPAVQPFQHPRAVAVDDDVLRVLCTVVDVELNAWQRAGFVDAAGRLLLEVGFGESELGLPQLSFLHQPSLETSLRKALSESSATVRLGDRVAVASTDADAVRLESGDRCRWLVGCDGANSGIRENQGIGWVGPRGAPEWLVVDAHVHDPLPEHPYFSYVCDPARPGVTMPWPGGHRWEWQLREGEQLDPSSLLPPGVEVLRSATYRFATRTAVTWRRGRVLLAGDAAHTMPPFAGQGMAAGIRDAAQLAWRLAELCHGRPREADPLGAWERERKAQLRQVVLLSRLIGALVTTRHDGMRDALLRGAAHTPVLGSWLRRGGPRPASGARLPSPRLRTLDGQVARLDDLLPWSWLRICTPDRAQPGDVVVLPPGGRRHHPDPHALEDLDGSLLRLLRRRGGVLTVRPDRLLA